MTKTKSRFSHIVLSILWGLLVRWDLLSNLGGDVGCSAGNPVLDKSPFVFLSCVRYLDGLSLHYNIR